MTEASEQAAELLGDTGPFADCVAGFAAREQQMQMAGAVAESLESGGSLVVEAGTGTGKTFAYLVPALLAGQKVIVSTGTRNLQDQLFQKDLPVVRKALQVSADVAMLKGRGNYLCVYRLGLAKADGRVARQQRGDLGRVNSWSGRTQSGDIGEMTDVAEDSTVWPLVTSTVDNCLGGDCPDYGECFLVKARRRAQDADLLIINHHLFCADMAIREEGFGEILPGADAFILDEAHQLPEIASRFFGRAIGSRQLTDLVRDCENEQRRDAADSEDLADAARRVEHDVTELRLSIGVDGQRDSWEHYLQKPGVESAFMGLGESLRSLSAVLEVLAVRGKGLESCLKRCQQLLIRLAAFADQGGDDNLVLWVDVRRSSFSLNATPLSIAEYFRERMAQYRCAWIFTSATLAVNQQFEHFCGQLGLEDPETLLLESPFDYQRNALLYHPLGLPPPSAHNYNHAMLEACLPVLEASGGRAFILFTSHHALRDAASWLAGKVEYPLLVQGDQPKNALLDHFRALGNAVLLGTSSFWEGVDVRGDALSCVVIAKLPFASPGDPVLQARIDALRRRGGNPFADFQLPQAVIALKQGVGRLIRDVDDRGVLMLCDPRLLTKPYGRVFIDSLPPMRRNRALSLVREFFAPDAEKSPTDIPVS